MPYQGTAKAKQRDANDPPSSRWCWAFLVHRPAISVAKSSVRKLPTSIALTDNFLHPRTCKTVKTALWATVCRAILVMALWGFRIPCANCQTTQQADS